MTVPVTAPPATTPEIPDKLYFRIGEVAQIAGVEPYVLRFWETEFPRLSPKKSGTGHRLYKRKEVETILEVKRLLYEKRFTIEGAKLYLEQNRKRGGSVSATVAPVKKAAKAPMQTDLFGIPPQILDDVRKELVAILALLK